MGKRWFRSWAQTDKTRMDLRKTSLVLVLRFEILRGGRPIYISDEEIMDRYEMETLHL